MHRRANRTTPLVLNDILYSDDAFTGAKLNSSAWFEWLVTASTFYYQGRLGSFTAHLEQRARGGQYWIAYRRQAGILRRVHLGKTNHLTREHLEQAVLTLDAFFARQNQ
ncbi:MAG: hypothetical protein ACYDBJ_29365 [Aggregatilineales bacterium]